MFRIKNVRNSTVAKQTNINHQNNYPIPPRVNPVQQKVQPSKPTAIVLRPTPRIQLNKKNEKPKLIIPEAQRKMVANSNLIKKNNEIVEKKPTQKNRNEIENKVEILENKIQTNKSNGIVKESEPVTQIKISPQLKIHQPPQQAKTIQSKPVQIKPQKLKIQIEAQQELQKKRQAEEKEKEQLIRQRKEEQRQRQEQQQRKNELKMKEMMQKVNARRKARQQEKQNRLRLQMERQNQSVGGIMALSDPLAHVEMSEAVMDTQVNRILTMKFANYPNKQAIERQVEELQRINRSYLLVRTDPTNSLNRGLSNFRIQLFNRVGELIMEAQASLGPSASGLQVIQSDSRNYPQIKGMHVTRGLQGHLSMLKKVVLKQIQECAICLCQIQKGKSIYDVECGHKFHEKCLQDWLNTNANCPACRYNIKYNHY